MKIKRFWGNTENTVRTQIYYAVIAYCLVAIIQHDMEIRNILKTKIPEYQQMIERFGRKIKEKYEENKEIDS